MAGCEWASLEQDFACGNSSWRVDFSEAVEESFEVERAVRRECCCTRVARARRSGTAVRIRRAEVVSLEECVQYKIVGLHPVTYLNKKPDQLGEGEARRPN